MAAWCEQEASDGWVEVMPTLNHDLIAWESDQRNREYLAPKSVHSAMRLSLLFPLLLSLCALAGCTGGSGKGESGSSDASVSADGDTPVGPCPTGTLCLQPFLVQPELPQRAGRLVILWYQPYGELNGLFDSWPLALGYDAPFEPGAERYEISLEEISEPPVPTLLCQWEEECLQQANPRPVGVGVPMVFADENGNDRIDPEEITVYGSIGTGMVFVLWSKEGAPVGSDALGFDGQSDCFPFGVEAGIHFYDFDGSLLDATTRPADQGGPFDLALCANASCNNQPPRLLRAQKP